MPDFRMQQSFPISSVIDAAGRNAKLQLEAREAGNQSLIAGLKSIGEVGQSLYDQKKRVAQSLALGKLTDVPEELAKTMEPEQIIKLAQAKRGYEDQQNYLDLMRKLMNPAKQPSADLVTPGTSGFPVKPAIGTPNHQAGAILASQVAGTPMPETTMNGGGLTPPTTNSMSVPIEAPPISSAPRKMISPAMQKLLQKYVDQNAPQRAVSAEQTLAEGYTTKNTRIINKQPSSANATWDSATPAEQGLAKARYEGRIRSGDLGFRERTKINALADQYATQMGLPPFQGYNADTNAAMSRYSATGKMGQNAVSLNTALGHLSSAYDSYEALGNTNQAWLNTPINKLKKETNDPHVVGLGINLIALQGELANVFKNTGGTDQEISKWRDYLNENLTPQQYIAAAGKIDDLLRSRVSALDYQRSQAGGGASLLSPKGKEISQKLGSLDKQDGWTPEKEQRFQELQSKRAGKATVSL